MRVAAAVGIALTGVISFTAGINGQVQVIKPEAPLGAGIQDAGCYPDVSDLRGTVNFVVVYPKYAGGPYDGWFKVFDSDGNWVGTEGVIQANIQARSAAGISYGVGVASNTSLFSCVFPELVAVPQHNTSSKQFLHSGAPTGSKILLDDLQNSSLDGTFRVTMPYGGHDTHFATENRVEFYHPNTDIEVITSGYPLRQEDTLLVIPGGGGYMGMDPVDVFGLDDAYDNDATSLESYAESGLTQWIMHSWTRNPGGTGNHVFARPGGCAPKVGQV